MSIEDDIRAIKDAVLEMRADAQSTLSKLGGAISLLANLSGILQIPSVVAGLLQLFGGPDSTQRALSRIENLLQVTFSFEQAEADFTQMHLVNDAVVKCRAALTALLLETPPYLPTALDRLNTETLTEVNLLESDPYWRRVFFAELQYQDFWFGRVEPPSGDISSPRPGRAFVFDYRLTLLGYVNALSVRTSAILLMLASGFLVRESALAEIQQRAVALDNFYQRILSGFVTSRIPKYVEVTYFDLALPGNPPLLESAFDILGSPGVTNFPTARPFGVISAHEGSGIVETYPADRFPNRTDGPFNPVADPTPEDYLEFAARYELGALKREKTLYVQIGLDHAWTSIQDLRRTSGQIPERIDPMLYWSMRDVLTALGSAAADLIDVPPGAPPPPLSVFDIVRRLAVVGKVNNSGKLIVSCREALEAATA